MGSPYQDEWIYTVPAGTGTFYYNKRGYKDGAKIPMNREDYLACQKTKPPAEEELSKCFPSYCDDPSTKRYAVVVDVPANGIAQSPVASIEGCKAPKRVAFHTCGNCMYVEYDAPALTDAADPNVVNGGGPDADPHWRFLDCTEVIHFSNPNDFDVKVTLYYYCD